MRVSLYWSGGVWLACLGLITILNCGSNPSEEVVSEKTFQEAPKRETEKASEIKTEQSIEPSLEPSVEPEPNTDSGSNTEPTHEQVQDAGVQDSPSVDKPSLTPKMCGTTVHKWLPTSKVGKLIHKETPAISSLGKILLEGLLNRTSYKGLVNIKYGVKIYKFRYETQDRGEKVEATGVMAFPDTQGKPLNAPYVLWLHGTSGFMDKCAPSRSQEGALSVALVASQGYIAVAPDYIGMNGSGAASTLPHAYLVGEAVALGSLDSLRAAGTLMKGVSKNVKPNGNMVIWGGSQGGHATLFSTLYAPYYAPEYKLIASVALVPPVDLLAQAEAAIAKLGKATITLAAGAAAMSRWYGFGDKLSEFVTDRKPYFLASKLPKMMDASCKLDAKGYKFTKTTDIFQEAVHKAVIQNKSWKGFEKWHCMMAENSFNRTSVVSRNKNVPILYVVSAKDDLVNPAVQRKSYDALCKQGYQMNYIECEGASHTKGAVWSLPSQFAWVEARLAGKPIKNNCTRPKPICCAGSSKKVCTP